MRDDDRVFIEMSRGQWLEVSARLGDIVNLQMRMGVDCKQALDVLNEITVALNNALTTAGE